MRVRISPSKANGVVQAPPSKSMAHRLLICAGLSTGESVVRGVTPSHDVLATIDCLLALGAQVDYDADTARVIGIGGRFPIEAALPCRECGSTLRFLIPVAMLGGGKMTFTGSRTLFSRPLSVYESIFDTQSVRYEKTEQTLTVYGALKPGTYRVPGNVSSQFVSGLCFALPLPGADSEIVIEPPIESRPYIDMTLHSLRQFGVDARWSDEHTLQIPGGQAYTPSAVTVEGDYSNAAFLDALNLFGGRVQVTGLSDDSLQGDRVYSSLFTQLTSGMPTIDLSDCPDLGPVCMAIAAAKDGAVFQGTRRLRIKESDRCASMAEELGKFGVSCFVQEDEMAIFGSVLHSPRVPLNAHNDHRIAMALSLLLTVTGGTLDGAQSVGKSFPDFYNCLRELGIKVETEYGVDS